MKYRPVQENHPYESGGFVSDYDRGGYRDEEPEGGFVSEEYDPFSEKTAAAAHAEKLQQHTERRMKKQRKKSLRTAIIVALLVILGGVFLFSRWARPPAGNRPMTEQTAESSQRYGASRKNGCYTFLIAGKDKAAGLTDTVLVGMMDTKAHTLRFVSIPRDTAVNISWSPKKINQYYPAAENQGQNGVTALVEGVEKLIGYRVDCYAIFDVEVFVELVDTMGGVWFDVPIDMNYDDPDQELWIHVNQGYQLLSGYDAMGVFRYRKTYVDGDIGRLSVQHDLLKAIASQLLTLGNIPNVRQLVQIYERDVITNLSTGNVMFFLKEFLKLSDENIVFDTIPGNYGGEVRGMSYVIIYLNQWLDYLNAYLNPFNEPITTSNLDLIYADNNGNLTATTGTIRGNDRW